MATSPTPAPWRQDFLTHVSQMPSPEFVLTTLHPSPTPCAVSHVPRARTCIFRGMWAELVTDPRNPADLNERIFESDALTLTTDVRMKKVPGFFVGTPDTGDITLSGGGGPVEALFWVKDSQTQWRIKGEAFIVAPDIDQKNSDGAQRVRKAIGEVMRVTKGCAEDQRAPWSWSRELTAHFGNLSPTMRGTFRNPPPGQPLSLPISDNRLGLGQKVSDVHDEVARQNFRVVIIKPLEVERMYLADSDKSRRWKYSYISPSGGNASSQWETEEEWP